MQVKLNRYKVQQVKMAKDPRVETGKKPTEGNYIDLIDSQFLQKLSCFIKSPHSS